MEPLPQLSDEKGCVDLAYPSLSGKIIVMTGASSGIGQATAKMLLKSGAHLYCLGRNQAAYNELEHFAKSQGTLRFFHCDLLRPVEIKTVFQSVMSETAGKLDGLINCAGMILSKEFRDTLLSEWDMIHTLNLRAPMQIMSMAVPYMREFGGSIVNVSASPVPRPKQTLFCVSKACLNSLTQCAALELGGIGIRVNAVAPDFTDTLLRVSPQVKGGTRPLEEVSISIFEDGLSLSQNAELMQQAGAVNPLQRVNSAKDVAHAIVWLVSDESSFVNGEILTVDGGASLQSPLTAAAWHVPEPRGEPEKKSLAAGLKNFFKLT